MKPYLLPANLSALADIAAKESTRYAMTGIRLELSDNGEYTAVATDSKILAMVTGPTDNYDDFPEIKELASAPNGQTAALIPVAAWKENLKGMNGRRTAKFKPILDNTAIVLGETVTTFGRTDLDRQQVQSTRNVDGRFPPYREIVPSKPAPNKITVDALLLAKILKTASAFNDEDKTAVEFGFYDSTKPATIRTKNRKGQVFTGLIMPMSPAKESREEELKRKNAARLAEQAPAMLEAIRKAYQALANIPQTDKAREVLRLAYDAARPDIDPTFIVQVIVDPSIDQTPDLTRIPKTITATCMSAANSEIGRLCRAIEIDNRLPNRTITARLEVQPDPFDLEPADEPLSILDNNDQDEIAIGDATVSD